MVDQFVGRKAVNRRSGSWERTLAKIWLWPSSVLQASPIERWSFPPVPPSRKPRATAPMSPAGPSPQIADALEPNMELEEFRRAAG